MIVKVSVHHWWHITQLLISHVGSFTGVNILIWSRHEDLESQKEALISSMKLQGINPDPNGPGGGSASRPRQPKQPKSKSDKGKTMTNTKSKVNLKTKLQQHKKKE